ncbi:MAG: ASCH domain-containing protein [Myxococcales bacterium]|nr:MAG: ASCH domain-containing protein [Myxococcales bacterium]
MTEDHGDAIAAFWEVARSRGHLTTVPGYFGPTPLESVPPPAWSFGGTPEQADELLALVLKGRKTATASARWDYESEDDVPVVGSLGIVLDGAGAPRALVSTTAVDVVRFADVTEAHAYAEGEGDRSLAYWRQAHEEFFTTYAPEGQVFSADMLVVVETFEVLYQH